MKGKAVLSLLGITALVTALLIALYARPSVMNKDMYTKEELERIKTGLTAISLYSDVESRLSQVYDLFPDYILDDLRIDLANTKLYTNSDTGEMTPRINEYSWTVMRGKTSYLITVNYRELEYFDSRMTTLIYLNFKGGKLVEAKVVDTFNNYDFSYDRM